ncbi:MAG: zf-TFIIB domain-containing protein [Gemmatimonadaceae bacterium]
MLRCPVDGFPLTYQAIGSASIAVCEKCSGIWFTREALLYPSVDPAALPPASRTPIPATGKRRTVGSCPVCRRSLLAERIEGIYIDSCVHCAGVWLDPGEYAAVRHRIENNHLAREAQAKSASGMGSVDRPGDGGEIVLALIEFLL